VGITVPKFNQQQVQATAAPNVRIDGGATADSFGGGRAFQESQQISNGLFNQSQKIFAEERAKADELLLTDFNTKVTQLKNKLIYDPKEGLMTRKGQDAFSAPDEYLGKFNTEVEEYKKSLSTQSQSQAANKIAQGHMVAFDGDIQRHVSRESQVYDEDTTKAALSAAHDDAVTNFHDPEKRQLALDAKAGTILRWAARSGLSDNDPIVQERMEEETSRTHAGIVDRMLSNGDDLDAKKYFDENKSSFRGETAANLEKALEEGSIRGESQRQSLSIASKYGSLNQALADVDKIEDPKLQDETRRRVKERFGDRASAKRLNDDQNEARAYSLFSKGGRKLEAIPTPLFSSLPPEDQERFRHMQAKKDPTITDWDTYEELKLGLSNPATRPKYLREASSKYRNLLSEPHFKQYIDDKAALAEGDEKVQAKFDGFLSDKETVDNMLVEAGVNPKKDGAKKYRETLDRLVEQHQQRTGKKVTNDELRKLGKPLLIDVVTDKGWIWDTKAKAFEVTDPSKVEDVVVPEQDEEQIVERFKRKYGKEPSRKDIVNRYLKGKALGG